MKAAQIENSLVVNVIEILTAEDAEKFNAVLCNDDDNDDIGIGWSYDGNEFSAPVFPAKTLDELKAIKKGQLDQVFNTVADRPIVDTGLGFEVNGGYQDLADFTVGEDLGITIIRAVDNSMNEVTEIQFKSIILAIKMNGLTLKQNKWALADAITAATTTEELDLININEGW